jgi:hypothetical protein
MQRLTLLSIILAAGACARQPICKPWSPATAATAAAAAPPDDGTTPLAGADAEDAWTSVVGAAPAVADADDAHAAHAVRPRRVAKVERKPATPKPVAAPPATTAAAAAPAAAKPAPNPRLGEAKKFYAGRCVPCHGPAGRGDGPTGLALDPHPRNFTDRGWQKTVTDLHIEKVILQGGPSVGKSPLMPPHGDLSDKPELLAAMREVVRGFGR